MIMLDNTVVNVALPSMQRSLALSLSELEWVVAGYALTFAAFMLTGGKLADLFGRRLIFMHRPRGLHRRLARVRPRPERRLPDRRADRAGTRRRADEPGDALDHRGDVRAARARARRSGSGPASRRWRSRSARSSAACSTEHVNWNWIFFINVPVGLIGLVRRSRSSSTSRATPRPSSAPTCPGLATSALGLFSLTYAFIEANNYGWTSARILGAFAVAAVVARRVRAARAAPARCRCSTSRSSATARSAARTPRCCFVGARDVRDVLLRLAVHAERPRLLAGRRRARASCR